MWLLVSIAAAAPVGFWHPDDLAPRSRLFVDASERLQSQSEERNRAVDQHSAALRQYRTALDLLGTQAPASETERLDALEKDYHRQFAVLQAFTDQLIADFDAAFTGSVDRAIAKVGEVAQCEATIAAGPRIPGMPSKRSPNPDCQGRDLNAELATAVDADPALKTALEAILAREWPGVTLPTEPQAPVGGGERWLSVHDLMMAGAKASLQAIDQRDDDARDAIEAKLEQGATTEEQAALVPEAERIEAETAKARADLAAPVLAASATAMAKWKGEPATGWCANPVALGGCTGADASRELVGRLVDDKKVAKAWP